MIVGGDAGGIIQNVSGKGTKVRAAQSHTPQRGKQDMTELSDELARLRAAMRTRAIEPGHDVAVAEIAQAETAARDGDDDATRHHLKKAGRWSFDVATAIGAQLAAAAIKSMF